MGKMNLYYAVLQYIPSSVRQEAINVGVAVHVPDMDYARFYPTQNTRRVAAFDDEYDKDYFKMMMDSLSYDINYPVDNRFSLDSIGDDQRFDELKSPNYLKTKTYYLSTEFVFMPIQRTVTTTESINKDIGDIKDAYLYYDKPKDKRSTTSQMRSSFAKQLRLHHIKSESLSNTPNSSFSKKPLFDFKLGDSLIKVQSFNYVRNEALAKELKSTLFDLQHVSFDETNQVIKIIVDDDARHHPSFSDFQDYIEQIERMEELRIHINSITSFMSEG